MRAFSRFSEAEAAFDVYVKTFEAKYEESVQRVRKDRDVTLTFFDFPAGHTRTTNPIAAIRLEERLAMEVPGPFPSDTTTVLRALPLTSEIGPHGNESASVEP